MTCKNVLEVTIFDRAENKLSLSNSKQVGFLHAIGRHFRIPHGATIYGNQ